MITRTINYSHFFKFEARIIHIPSSFNRIGIDPYPRFYMKPMSLLEVMLFSEDPRSTDFDFIKDKESGFYLKNRATIDEEEIAAQFDFISIRPPYSYHNEDTFVSWTRITMDPTYSGTLQSKFFKSTHPIVKVNQGTEGADLEVEHYYKKCTSFTTAEFSETKVDKWPKESNVIFTDMNTGKTGSTFSTTSTPSNGY